MSNATYTHDCSNCSFIANETVEGTNYDLYICENTLDKNGKINMDTEFTARFGNNPEDNKSLSYGIMLQNISALQDHPCYKAFTSYAEQLNFQKNYKPTGKLFEFRSAKKTEEFKGYSNGHPRYGSTKYQYFFLTKDMTKEQADNWLNNNSINFGKHKGTPINQVEGSYIQWLLKQVESKIGKLVTGGTAYSNYKRTEYISNMIHHCMKFTSLPLVDVAIENDRIAKAEKIKQQKKASLANAAKKAQNCIGLDTEFTVINNTKQIMDAKYTGINQTGKHTFQLDHKTILYIRPVKAITALELIEGSIYKLQGIIQVFSRATDKVRRAGVKQLKVM